MAHKKAYRKGFVVFPKIGYSHEEGEYSEQEAIRGFGLRSILFDWVAWNEHEILWLEGVNKLSCYKGIAPMLRPHSIYRGWPMENEQYKRFFWALHSRGIYLLNTPAEYYAMQELLQHKADLTTLANETGGALMHYEQKALEGLYVPEHADFQHYDGQMNQYRVFYYWHRPAVVIRHRATPEAAPVLPNELIERFRLLPSFFYTLDFTECEDGQWVVTATGDGQVKRIDYEFPITANRFYLGLRNAHQKAREEWVKDDDVKDIAMFFKIFDSKGILT